MRSAETRIYPSIKSNWPSRTDGRFFLVSVIVILAIVTGLLYIYLPPSADIDQQPRENKTPQAASVNDKEKLLIKELLVEYAHAILLGQLSGQKKLFTDNFAETSDTILTDMLKVSSVQISQPTILLTPPHDARVRFNQTIRTSNDSRRSQERLLLKRASATGWRIDKRVSHPILHSDSNADASFRHNPFLYIKSEQEKQLDTANIIKLIQFWADAKAEADLEGVVTTYRRDIWQRKGVTKQRWLESFRDPKKITITNVNVVFPSQNLAEVTLNEQIELETKRSYVDMHLTLQLADNGWLISEEDSNIVSEQVILRPELKSMVKAAEAITEPTLLVGPETIAISKPTSGADIAPDKATQKARPDIPSVNETMAIQDLVGRWKQAWSNKDIDAYLGYYSDIFLPKSGMSIEQWRRYRRVRLSKPKTIDIQIRDLQITQQGQTRAIVTFTQIYESNLFQDEIEKTLSLVKEENEWKIVSEKTRPLKSPAS